MLLQHQQRNIYTCLSPIFIRIESHKTKKHKRMFTKKEMCTVYYGITKYCVCYSLGFFRSRKCNYGHCR